MNQLLKEVNMGYYTLYVYEKVKRDYNSPWKSYQIEEIYSISVKKHGRDEKFILLNKTLEEVESFIHEVEKRELCLYTQLREFLKEFLF